MPVARIRYQVAMSLDGYIAGPQGEAEWIVADPEIDFAALFAQFDTFLMGRRTYEGMAGAESPGVQGKTFVFSKTLRSQDHRKVTVLPEVSPATVEPIRAQARKDIWLFGGGLLFRSFLATGLVDTVEVAVIPVLLGSGLQLLPSPATDAKLRLTGHRVYNSGIILLEYAVVASAAPGLHTRP